MSKLHAAVERRGASLFVRDLGSTNGTVVNGRLVRDYEVEVKDADRIQVGPIVITVCISPEKPQSGTVEDLVANWLHGEGTPRSNQDDSQATELLPTTAETVTEQHVKFEVIQDVLVVTPQVTDLDDAETIELLRSQLHALFDSPTPRQVVVNLEYIRHLSAAGHRCAPGPPPAARPGRRSSAHLPGARPRHGRLAQRPFDHAGGVPSHTRRGRLGLPGCPACPNVRPSDRHVISLAGRYTSHRAAARASIRSSSSARSRLPAGCRLRRAPSLV